MLVTFRGGGVGGVVSRHVATAGVTFEFETIPQSFRKKKTLSHLQFSECSYFLKKYMIFAKSSIENVNGYISKVIRSCVLIFMLMENYVWMFYWTKFGYITHCDFGNIDFYISLVWILKIIKKWWKITKYCIKCQQLYLKSL